MINLWRVALLLLGATCTWKCFAVDYFLDPKFAASQRYDSNLLMRIDPEQYNLISTLSPGVGAGFRRENSELKTNFTWNQLLYDNQTELNFDERLFSLVYQHSLERWNFNLTSSYNSESSLNTESFLSGARFIKQTSQIRRNTLNLSPTASYDFDEKDNVSLNYLFSKTTYDKSSNSTNTNSNLSDYDYHQLTSTFSHLYSEQDKFTLSLSGSKYTTPYQEQTAVTESAQLGWQHSFSEQWIASIAGGGRYTQTESTITFAPYKIPNFPNFNTGFYVNSLTGELVDYSSIDTKTTGFGQTFNGSLQKNFERGALTLGASQQLTPTAQGQQQQSQLTFDGSYALTERWSTSINGNYSTYELPNQQNSGNNRTSYYVSPILKWKWTPEINLGLSYSYRQQKYDRETQIREGDIVQFQFTYQPQINRQVK